MMLPQKDSLVISVTIGPDQHSLHFFPQLHGATWGVIWQSAPRALGGDIIGKLCGHIVAGCAWQHCSVALGFNFSGVALLSHSLQERLVLTMPQFQNGQLNDWGILSSHF